MTTHTPARVPEMLRANLTNEEFARLVYEAEELRAQRDELLKACELFTKAAQDAVRDLNNNGLACPASIAYAAEQARAAIAKCKS